MPRERSITEIAAIVKERHGVSYVYEGFGPKQGIEKTLIYTCSTHGKIVQKISQHLKTGCGACSRIKGGIASRQTLNEYLSKVKPEFIERFTYLELDYTSGKARISFNCPQHGRQDQLAAWHLTSTHGCPHCALDNRPEGRKAYPTAVWEKRAKDQVGDAYLGLIIRGGRKFARYTCSTHGVQETLITNLEKGVRCLTCSYEQRGTKKLITWTPELERQLHSTHKNAYTYRGLGVAADGKRTVLCTCTVHGDFEQKLSDHQRGIGCVSCGYEQNSVNGRDTLEEAITKARSIHGGKYEYLEITREAGINTVTRLKISCPTHGEFIQRYGSHLNGDGCPKCSNRVSKPVIEIGEYLTSLGITHTLEKQLPGSALFWDIVIDSAKLAIEFHGVYWHSEQYRDKNYHLRKHQEGLRAGYRTIHIFSDEWANKQVQVKSLIVNALNRAQHTGYARQCVVGFPPPGEIRKFLETYHIQGYISSSRYVGLYQGDRLVSLLGYELKTPGRGVPSTSMMEVTRYASVGRVTGGFSKLLNWALKQYPTVKQVYSFSDIRMFSGKMYSSAGFKQAYTIKPDYWYTFGTIREHKSNFQKSRFKASPNLIYQEGLTERELAKLNKLYRIYDCGKVKWVKNV